MKLMFAPIVEDNLSQLHQRNKKDTEAANFRGKIAGLLIQSERSRPCKWRRPVSDTFVKNKDDLTPSEAGENIRPFLRAIKI